MSFEDDSGAGGFAAGEPWYLDVTTGEWSRTPPPPDRRRPPGRGSGKTGGVHLSHVEVLP